MALNLAAVSANLHPCNFGNLSKLIRDSKLQKMQRLQLVTPVVVRMSYDDLT